MDLNQIRNYMTHGACIELAEVINLIKKYPNDADLGARIRKLYYKKT